MQFYDTSNIPTDLAKRSFAAGLTRIMPNGSAPLFAMSGYAKKTTALQIEHGYWSKTMIYPSVTVNGSHLSTDTTINVDSSIEIVPGELLRFQKAYAGTEAQHTAMAEIMLVENVVSATQITVVRGFAGSTPAALPDNTVLVSIGSAFEQGSNAPTSRAVKPVRHLNNTQIFRDAWDITGTLAAVQMEQGYNTVTENKADCGAFHAQAIEKAAFFSKKSMGWKNGRPLSTMDGIESLIQQYAPANLYEAGATTSYTQLETYLNPVFDYMTDAMSGNVRTLFVGGTAMQVINNIGRLSGVYQIMDGQTGFGLQFKQFKTSRGTFNIIEHPLFNTNTDWKKMAVAVDLSSFDFAYLQGRDTFHTEINGKGMSTNGRDAIGGVLTSELTVQMTNPFACAIIYNLRAAA